MKTFLPLLLSCVCWSVSLRAQGPVNVAAMPTEPKPPIQTGGEIAARAAMDVWLGLLDDGQFDKAWDNASNLIQKAVPKEQWVQTLSQHRPPLGKVLARIFKEARSTTTLPGTPAGQYVVVVYDTSFEHKKAATETLTAALENGGWKVSGYFVK